MSRLAIHGEVLQDRVIAIARRVPRERVLDVADVLRDTGIRTFEVTLDSGEALDVIGSLSARGHLVGAGTVRRAYEVEAAADAGAQFIVSPHTDSGVVTRARELELPVMSGAMTPTEAVHAWDLGVSAVKLFPATVVGPGFLASIRGPLTDIAFIPTGGIDAGNAGTFIDAGAVAVGVGGWLTGPEALDVVRARAAELVQAVRLAG